MNPLTRRVPRPHPPAPLLLATTILVSACTSADSRNAAFTVRDSAGIRIAESAAPVWREGRGWRIGDEPELRVGRADGPEDQLLFRVGGGRLLPDGGFLLATDLTEVRRYDADGRLVWRSGRSLAGPGEFSMIAALDLLPGDSVGVFDGGLSRYTVLDAQGRLARVVALAGLRGGSASPVGRFPGGSLLIASRGAQPDGVSTGRWRSSDPFVRVDLADGAPDTIGVFPGQEGFTVAIGDGGLAMNPPFFHSRAQALRDSSILVAYTERFEVLEHDENGALRGIWRIPFEPQPVTSEQIEAWKASRAASLSRTAPASPEGLERRRVAVEMTFPATHPVIWRGSMLLDAAGNVWVRHAGEPESTGGGQPSRTWSVFDPDGRWLGRVEAPEDLVLLDIGEDRVLALRYDPFGVDQVEVRRLVKR